MTFDDHFNPLSWASCFWRYPEAQLWRRPLLPFRRPDDAGGVDPLKLKFACSRCKHP